MENQIDDAIKDKRSKTIINLSDKTEKEILNSNQMTLSQYKKQCKT